MMQVEVQGAARNPLEHLRVDKGVLDLWSNPSRDAERVSQLLLGATVSIVEEDGAWVRVQGPDTYRGWAERRFLAEWPNPPSHALAVPFVEVRRAGRHDSPLVLRLPFGAGLAVERAEGGWSRAFCGTGCSGWVDSETITEPRKYDEPVLAAVDFALTMLGTPYLWGGSSTFGFDCSGLVQCAYGRSGVVLRRDADQQRLDPRFELVNRDELRAGDLLFFGTEERIGHVAMQIGAQSFVHAAGGDGTIVTEWGDPRFTPGFVDARRLRREFRSEPVTRWEDPAR
ncbi:MAG: NlpC/P60 family protein [Armatimonadota bacterium]